MENYRLVFRASVSKDLSRLPKNDLSRVLERIKALALNPRGPGCEKLSGAERYRVRQGVYRIVYEIRDGELLVIVVKVGHRRDVYRPR